MVDNGRRLDLYKNRSYVMNYDTKCMGVFHLQYNTGSNPVLTTKMNKVMKNEKWFNGFLLGLFIGGILGIVILDLVQRGIL